MNEIRILGLETVPEIKAGDNLAQIICECAKNENVCLKDKDIVVLTSKIISKALGLTRKKADVKLSKKALLFSKKTCKDPIWVQMILDAGHQVIAVLPLGGAITKYIVDGSVYSDNGKRLCENEKCLFITRSPSGRIHTCDAGIDGSNHPEGIVSLFPDDPDGEALKIRREIERICEVKVAVILADTELTAYGTIDTAVGSSGINPCSVMFGKKDRFGRPKFGGIDLVAQEIASACALLFGQTDAGIPVAVIRGLDYQFDEERNISNTLRFAGGDKDILKLLSRTMKATSYVTDGLGRKLLLRIGSRLVR